MTLASQWAKRRRDLLTSDAVLIELANFFARSPLRTGAYQMIRTIRAARGWTVDAVEPTLLARAERNYGVHPDKAWSLTDCISMELMRDHGATEVASPDKHFTQAGFRKLLK